MSYVMNQYHIDNIIDPPLYSTSHLPLLSGAIVEKHKPPTEGSKAC